MVIKCILFDCDGVIITSEKFSDLYQKRYDLSNDEMLPFFEGDFQKCIVGKADLKEIIKSWLPKWKWKGSIEEFLQLWFKSENKIDERIVKLITILRKKGIKCCLATNQEKYRTDYLKTHMGFKNLFDHIFSSADIGHKKPKKEFFEFILNEMKNKYNICALEIMYFDNSQRHINSAKKLGIKTHLYKNFKESEPIIKSIIKNSIYLID